MALSDTQGDVSGCVFDIQRFSLHDGPGVRTTVFLKGCPLRCLWCHNPEGMSGRPEVSFHVAKCVACGECVRVCPNGAHRLQAATPGSSAVIHIYDRGSCDVCGRCTEVCDTGALEFIGRAMSVDDVMKEVNPDRVFYATSGGGLTISGGEPLAQTAFTLALLRAAQEAGIHACLQTSGFASWQQFQQLLPLASLFLFDCKETDAQRHKDFTGQSNSLILENLRRLHAAKAKIQLQCPIAPGFNDREDHLEGILTLAQSLPGLEGVRLLPYHPLGKSKLERLGYKGPCASPEASADPSLLERWSRRLLENGVRVLNPPPSKP